jgi:hypothetical protein
MLMPHCTSINYTYSLLAAHDQTFYAGASVFWIEDQEGERFPPEHLVDFLGPGGANGIHHVKFGDEFIVRSFVTKREAHDLEPGFRFRILVEKGDTAENGVDYPFRVTLFNMNMIDVELEHGGSGGSNDYVTIDGGEYLGQLADNNALFVLRTAEGVELFSIQLFPSDVNFDL